jgi:16S rRNA processing protein RimM
MALRELPHPKEAAKRLSRRTEDADPAKGAPRICVGLITGPQGVRGAVRIKSFTEVPEDIAAYGPVEDEAGCRRVELHVLGSAKGVLIVRIPGVQDRDEAAALRGLRLYLPRTALPQTDPDEYYHADLIGLEAVLQDGTRVGHVRAIYDFGAGDTLEIVRDHAPPVLVPFTRAAVPIVSPTEGRVILDPPPGLLDESDQ